MVWVAKSIVDAQARNDGDVDALREILSDLNEPVGPESPRVVVPIVSPSAPVIGENKSLPPPPLRLDQTSGQPCLGEEKSPLEAKPSTDGGSGSDESVSGGGGDNPIEVTVPYITEAREDLPMLITTKMGPISRTISKLLDVTESIIVPVFKLFQFLVLIVAGMIDVICPRSLVNFTDLATSYGLVPRRPLSELSPLELEKICRRMGHPNYTHNSSDCFSTIGAMYWGLRSMFPRLVGDGEVRQVISTHHFCKIKPGNRDDRPIDKRSMQWEKDDVTFFIATVIDYHNVATRTIVFCDEVVDNCFRLCRDVDAAARDKLIIQKSEALLGFLSGSAGMWSAAKGGSAEYATVMAVNMDRARAQFTEARSQGGALAHHTENLVVFMLGVFVLVSIILYLGHLPSPAQRSPQTSSPSTQDESSNMPLDRWYVVLLRLWLTFIIRLQGYLEHFTGFVGTCLHLIWYCWSCLLRLWTGGLSGIFLH